MKKTTWSCDMCGSECRPGVAGTVVFSSSGRTLRLTVASASADAPDSEQSKIVSDLCMHCVTDIVTDKEHSVLIGGEA